MIVKELCRFTCCGCGQEMSANEDTETGEFCFIHPLPECDEFMKDESPDEFFKKCRIKMQVTRKIN